MPTALITGITGQDGSYLAELLLDKGYEVHGIIRRASSFNTARIDHLYQDPHVEEQRLFLHYGDMLDPSALARVLAEVRPDEVYNLAAQSHVKVSFDQPAYTGQVDAIGLVALLESAGEAAREGREMRLYQASTSEMFGSAPPMQRETTPFAPRSPYAAAKVYAHQLAGMYRDAYELHVSCGILFNHESPRRDERFVTRKVTRAAARIKAGLQDALYLGNLDAKRDWGWAPDYVTAMWLMLQQDAPGDYVIATGEMHTVKELVEYVFGLAGLDCRHVVIDDSYRRPLEVDALCGDASRARKDLGWEPSVKLGRMLEVMLNHDSRLAARERRGQG